MARFYGWPPHIIQTMAVKDFNLYLAAICPITAEETTRLLEATQFPHTKEGYQKKISDKWNKRLFKVREQKPLSTDELDDFVGRHFK